MKLWLDSNISLDLSRDAIAAVEEAIRFVLEGEPMPYDAELENAANVIRAHLQHVLTEPGLEDATDQELLS
jgi:hypothetical protein